MHLRFQNIAPHPLLKGYVEKMWLFESSGKMPNADVQLVVPNGRLKLVIPFRNGITAKKDGWFHHSKEHSITLVGVTDLPSTFEIEKDEKTGTIGVEFSPQGAYRFFRLPLNEITNQIHPLTDILGQVAKELQEQISNVKDIRVKADLLQQFLLGQLMLQEEDSIFEYCVAKIAATKGKITINELEKKTGYSSRWLNMKFKNSLGISPKNFSTIIRFKQYYNAVSNNEELSFMKNEFYDFYYDQSHFMKEFKRFTGLSHAGFDKTTNDFGKLFYKE